jgi:hypothetical protein
MADSADDFQKQHDVVIPPKEETTDEAGIAGHAPDPTSDDDVLEAAQKVGLYDEVEEENPPVDIAGEVEKDEEGLKDIPPDEAKVEEKEK